MPYQPLHAAPRGRELAPGTIGLATSTVMGIASTAPLYTMAATLGLIVMDVGAQAPAVLILAFVPMLLTALAYRELSGEMPDSGTAFRWVAEAIGPRSGWIVGWSIALSGVLSMASQTHIAATYLWLLADDGAPPARSRLLVTMTGLAIIAMMTWVSHRDVGLGSAAQWVLVCIQYAAIIGFVVSVAWGLASGSRDPGMHPSASWLNPFEASDAMALGHAVLLTIFIYWGWDTCLAMSEETIRPRRTPAQAALLSGTLLMLTFVAVCCAAMAYAGIGASGMGLANPDISEDIFFALKNAIFGPFGWFLVLAVAVSSLATCHMTILPTARSTFAMASHHALPAPFRRIHPRFRTPTVATLAIGALSAAVYVALSLGDADVLTEAIEGTGVTVAFTYVMTSVACVVYFRGRIFTSLRNSLLRGILPAVGGVMMAGVLIYALMAVNPPNSRTGAVPGLSAVTLAMIAAFVVGLGIMTWWSRKTGSRPFFGRKTGRHADPGVSTSESAISARGPRPGPR